jgi:crossover junction endodeoxyribonuclease RuvC
MAEAQTIRILGIDPGLANCGWGVVEACGRRLRALAHGCISTKATDGTPERLGAIFNEIQRVIKRYGPTELGIETIYHKGNPRSSIATAQARGAALAAAATSDMTVGEYSPATIKKAVVGNGAADKDQVQYMVRVILELDHKPEPDHAADALAAAICQANLRNALTLEGASA